MSLKENLTAGIKESCFIRSRGGQVIFFPNGPRYGYLLPDDVSESEALSEIWKSWRITFVVLPLSYAIGLYFELAALALTVVTLLDVARYDFRLKRFTAGMIKLPRSLSVRLVAMSDEPTRLWFAFLLALLLAAICIGVSVFVLFAPAIQPVNPIPGFDPYLFLYGGALFLFASVVNGYMLVVRSRIETANQPVTHENYDE